MKRKRTPEWINTQKANINWVKAYVEAITNDRHVSLIRTHALVKPIKQRELFSESAVTYA